MTNPPQTVETLQSAESATLRTERLPVLPLPLTPLEKFLFECDTAHSPMIMRVVLRLFGESNPEVLLNTLQRAISRHPLINCRLSGAGKNLYWVAGEPEEISVSTESGSVFRLDSGILNRRIDLRSRSGLHTQLVFMDDGVKMYMDVHHAVTDGNGLRQVITDWLHLYHCAMESLPSRLPVIDPDRLQQRHLFPQPPSAPPIGLKESIRNLMVTVRGRTARWPEVRSAKKDLTTAHYSYCEEHLLSDQQSEAVQQSLSAWKVTLNDLVMASCLSVFARLSPETSPDHRITVLNPTDLRMPSDRSLPAANRFGFAFIRRRRSECGSPAKLLKGIHDEMLYVRNSYVGVEFIKGLNSASRIPGGVNFLRKMGLFIPSMQWTCLGDVTRGARRLMPWKDGYLHSGGLRLEAATAFAPYAESVPLSVAACEAGKRVTLTVRTSPAYVSQEMTRQFATVLIEQLCTLEMPPAESDQVTREEKREC